MSPELQRVLGQPIGDWQRGDAPLGDVALSSRVRLARNVADLPFPPTMNAAQCKDLLDRMERAIGAGGQLGDIAFERLEDLSPLDRQVLVEKHLISPQHARSGRGAVFVRPDEALSGMVLEEDHLRLQSLRPGLQLTEAWAMASQADDVLESKLEWAFSEEWGFLATCPTNVGTAMRASVMLHLPALGWTGRISPLLTGLSKVGVVVRGMYGEGTSAAGNIYQISNQTSLGQPEQEVASHLQSVCREVIEHERGAREALYREMREAVEDRVGRAYGILSNARIINSTEALPLLSDLRLGVDLHILSPLAPEVWSELLVLTRAGFLQRLEGAETPHKRDVARATLLRKRLAAAFSKAADSGDGGEAAR